MIDKVALKVLSLAAIATLMIAPTQAFAWGGQSNWDRDRDHNRGHSHRKHDSYRRHHDHFPTYRRHYPRHGSIVFDLPFGAVKVVIGGKRYYYCDGIFYNRSSLNYVVIPPPVGAVVTVLPAGIQPVIINGNTYYASGGIYYQYTSQGYVVIPPPTATIVQSAQPYKVDLITDTSDSFTVNVANAKGGYTAVALKKSGEGFVGPQGEYYPEFPKVEQLKIMYGK